MTERYTGIPANQILRQQPEGSQNASADQTREQTGSARENIHNAYMDMQQRFRSSHRGTLAEIRDQLWQQAIIRELEDMASVRLSINEKLNRKREETLSGSQEGGEKITVGKLLLSLVAGLLSAPAELAEPAAKDSKREAEQAA